MANSIVSAFRRRYPDDPRSDDEITLSIGSAYPEYSDPARFPDFHSDLQRLTKASQPQPNAGSDPSALPPEFKVTPIPPTVGDYFKQAAGTAVRSFTSTLGSIPEAVGSAARIAGTYSVPGAEYVPMRFETEPGAVETALSRAGEAVAYDPVPGLEKSFLATDVPGAVASGGAFIVGGAAAGAAEIGVIRAIGAGATRRALASGIGQAEAAVAGKSAMTIAAHRLAYGNIAALGALSQAQSGYEEARKAGADEHTRWLAFSLNLPVGMTEAVPLANILNRADKLSGGNLKQALVHATVDTFEEALQNAFQGVAGDVIAARVAKYDPDRKMFDSIIRDAGSGGISAAILSLASSALGGKLRRAPSSEQGGTAAPPPPGTGAAPPAPGAAPAAGGAASSTATGAPAPAAAPEVAAQYASPEEQAAAHAAQMLAVARRSVYGGFEGDDLAFVSRLPANEQITYQGLVEQARKEKDAADQIVEQQRSEEERRRNDEQLRAQEEDRQRQAAEQSARAAGGVGGGVPQQAGVGELTTTPTSDAAPGAGGQPVTAPEKGIVTTPPALAALPASDLPPALEALALKAADPKAGRFTDAEMALLPKSTDAIYAAYQKRVAELAAVFRGRPVPVPVAVAPAPVVAAAPVPAPTPAPARAPLPSPVRPVAAPSISNVYVPGPGQPAPVGLVARARARAAALVTTAKQKIAAVLHASPILDRIDFDGSSPLTFELSGRGAGTKTKLKPMDPNLVIVSKGDYQGYKGMLVVEGDEAAGVPSEIRLDSGDIIKVMESEYAHLEKIRKTMLEGGSLAEQNIVAPFYFELREPPAATDEALQAAGLVSLASVTKDVDHGSRTTWTHRWTVFRVDNRILFLPTYKSEGRIMAMEAGKQRGTRVVDLMKRGYVPIASYREKKAVHAREAAKPVMGADEFERTFASHARDRMGAMARTYAAVTAGMEPTQAVTTETVTGTAGSAEVFAGAEETVTGAGQTVQAVLPVEIGFSDELAHDLYPKLTKVLAGTTGRLTPENSIAAIANYAKKGKYGEEIRTEVVALRNEIGEDQASRAILGHIVRSYNNSRTSEGFADALSGRTANELAAKRGVRGFPGAVVNSPGGRRSQPGSVAVPAQAGNAPVAQPTPTVTQAWARSQPKFTIRSNGYASENIVRSLMQGVLERLAAAGVSIEIFQKRLDGLVDEFYGRTGGVQYGNAVQLVFADITKPTLEDLITVIHEAVHVLAFRESPEMQRRMHKAIAKLSDLRLFGSEGPGDVRASEKNIEGLDPEELANERLAESLANEGLDAIASRSWAQTILRYMKDLWNRACMAIQSAMFGEDAINPERVLEYYRNRLRSMLAGNPMPLSFVDFLGGQRLHLERRLRFNVPVDGSSTFEPVVLDWENGQINYAQDSSATVGAAVQYIRNAIRSRSALFRKPTYVSEGEAVGGDNPTVRGGIQFAAANGVQDALTRCYDAFNASGANPPNTSGVRPVTFDIFIGLFQGELDHPQEIKDGIQGELNAIGAPQVNPDLRSAGSVTFESDAIRKQSQAIELSHLNQWLGNMNRIFTTQIRRREIIGLALANTINRAEKLAARFQNLSFHFEAAKEAISDLIIQTKEDIREGIGLAKHVGMLTQALRELQARVTDPLPPQYQQLVDRMARRIFNDVEHFTEFLQAVAAMDVDWHGQTIPQIKTQLRGLLAANPLFSSMDADEQNVALALSAAFARSNDHQMAWLAVMQSNNMEAVAAIREMLNEARKDTTAGLNAARGLVNRVPVLARQAQRILDHYLQARREARSWLDDQVRNTRIIHAHDVSAPLLGQAVRSLETELGGSRPIALVEGARMPYVLAPTDTPEEIAARDPWEYRSTGTDVSTPAQVGTQVRNYRAWVEANRTTGGAMVNTLEDLANRLDVVDAGKQAIGIRQGLLARAFGSLSDACFQSGSVVAQRIGKALTRYSFLEGSFIKELSTIGARVSASRGRAMKALGIKNSRYFSDTFSDGAFGYFEKRKDLLERPDAHEAALGAWRAALLANPVTRPMMTADAWEKLKTYYHACVDYNTAQARIAGQMGIKIQDNNLGMFRDPIGDPLFTMPRGLNTRIELLFNEMRDQWNGVKSPRMEAGDMAQRFVDDPAALQAALRSRFTPEVWRLFVGEMANRDGRALFSGRQWAPGKWTIAQVANARRAFNEAGGDALLFAVKLHEFEGGTPDSLPAFVGETLGTFQNYFNAIEGIMAESENAEKKFGLQKGVPRFLMDARVSEDFPTGWLRYQHLDEYHAKQAIHRFAFHAAFGRNGETVARDFDDAIRELHTAAIEWEEYLRRARNLHPLKGKAEILKAAREMATAEGRNLSLLEHAAQNTSVLGKTQRQMEAWFRSHSVDSVEPRVFLEMLSFITSLMVQGPKTAIINTMDLIGGPVIQYGLTKDSLRQVRDNWTGFFGSAFGSLFQTIGIQINSNIDDRLLMRELGLTDPDNAIKLMDRFASAVNSETFGSGRISGGIIRAGRVARAITQAGLPARTEGEGLYPTLKLAPFSMASRWMNEAFILGNWGRFRGLASRAVAYLRAHPAEIDNDAFRFTADMMGFPKGTFMDEAASFEAQKEAMNRWGMSLETVARAALRPGAPLFTDDQFRALAEMALEEMSLESSPNTAPRWGANPVGRATMPLLRWSFAKTNQIRKSFQEPSGPKNLHSVLSGLKVLALATGVGIGYALLMGKYDEELTGKKSNIRGFGQDNNFLAAVEMTARMGSLGIWGDIANTVGNYAGTGDLRGMSLDNRVVFVNSLINTLSAITTFAKQGDATYATVYRQLVQSLGGAGYMQIAQILNNALSLDNAEARVTSRINVNNWLRAVGREMNLDVRTGRAAGAYANTNTIKPWVGEMLLAALADDQADFIAAYSKAIEAAREEGKPDPAKHVQQSYAAYNPLRTVFTTPPTEAEFAQLLMRLPESGRADVQAAILLFNKYGGEIGVNEYEGRVEDVKPPPRTHDNRNASQVRRDVAAHLFPARR